MAVSMNDELLWCLATLADYCTVDHLFEVARSTVCEIYLLLQN